MEIYFHEVISTMVTTEQSAVYVVIIMFLYIAIYASLINAEESV